MSQMRSWHAQSGSNHRSSGLFARSRHSDHLAPGNYGAIVSGVSEGTGVGLVEVFEVP
jgi:hypothetical protein